MIINMLKCLVIGVLLWHETAALTTFGKSRPSNLSEPHSRVTWAPTVSPLRLQDTDYVVTKGVGAHKLHRLKLSWDDAKRVCLSEGGYLADIKSGFEHFIIDKLMKDHAVDRVWLGVHYKNHFWLTLPDDREVRQDYGWAVWHKFYGLENGALAMGRPGEGQFCAFLLADGLVPAVCSYPSAFICKKPDINIV